MELFGGLAALALIVVIYVAWSLKSRRPRLAKRCDRVLARLEDIAQGSDMGRIVLEADVLLDSALGSLGYTGSMADKLRQAGPRFSNLDAIWSVHKLRNRIAHEVGVSVSASQANNAIKVMRRAIESLR